MSVSVLHFRNRSKVSGREPRSTHETVHHAFMRVVVTSRKGDKISFRVEGLDSQPVSHKKLITAAYVEAHVKELSAGQVVAFADVKAWWYLVRKLRVRPK